MKNLDVLVSECENDLSSIGITFGTVRNWTINTRAKKRWGQCKKISSDVFDINISYRLLDDNVSDQAAKNTIMHELLHTVKGCYGHKGLWKTLADKVNKLLPQYTIKRTTSSSEKGVAEISSYNPMPYRYTIECLSCGKISYRKKKSRVIEYPSSYRCGCCGGKLKASEI